MKIKQEYKGVMIHFGNPLGCDVLIDDNIDIEFFYRNYPFLFEACHEEGCQCLECNKGLLNVEMTYKKKK